MAPRLQVGDGDGDERDALERMGLKMRIDGRGGGSIAVDNSGAAEVQNSTQTTCEIVTIGLDEDASSDDCDGGALRAWLQGGRRRRRRRRGRKLLDGEVGAVAPSLLNGTVLQD